MMSGSGRLCLLFCLLLTVFYPRWRYSMVVGSCDRCITLNLITGEFKQSLLPALLRLSVNRLWLPQCPGFHSSSLPGSKACTKIQVVLSRQLPTGGFLAPRPPHP
ncbi:hypothetical protein AMECASPLE_018387 [Ameca splendens]|uniref:Secreted protein n=1 Tax=Ameca splendens TaxID=208324 RepID=A0ABV0Z1D9_9TELE